MQPRSAIVGHRFAGTSNSARTVSFTSPWLYETRVLFFAFLLGLYISAPIAVAGQTSVPLPLRSHLLTAGFRGAIAAHLSPRSTPLGSEPLSRRDFDCTRR
jgi:hypothetical protein